MVRLGQQADASGKREIGRQLWWLVVGLRGLAAVPWDGSRCARSAQPALTAAFEDAFGEGAGGWALVRRSDVPEPRAGPLRGGRTTRAYRGRGSDEPAQAGQNLRLLTGAVVLQRKRHASFRYASTPRSQHTAATPNTSAAPTTSNTR